MNTETNTGHTNVTKREAPRTDFPKLVEDMNAGVFEQQINRAFSVDLPPISIGKFHP